MKDRNCPCMISESQEKKNINKTAHSAYGKTVLCVPVTGLGLNVTCQLCDVV